jgi:hypothetical protein
MISERLQSSLFVTLELSYGEAQAGSDLLLGDLLDVTMKQDAVSAPGISLERRVGGGLQCLDRFEQKTAQRSRRIGLAIRAQARE